MLISFDYGTLEELSKGKGLNQIQNIFNIYISDLTDFLGLQSLYRNIEIKLVDKKKVTNESQASILDFGVERIFQNDDLLIKILLNEKREKFLPFVLFREACYCFIPYERSELVKICINQIVENYLNRLTLSKDWKRLIRDSLVDMDFIDSELDRLQKFFKIEAKAPLENVTQFFFKEIRENVLICKNDNIDRFYDIIFEKYTYKISRSLFKSEIIETLRIIIQIFYNTKLYLNLTDYQTLFKKYKDNKQIDTNLSLRKFTENLQWINNCSSIAPSYDYSYSTIGLHLILGTIRFNPFLEKIQIKKVIERWPFLYLSKISGNSFSIELSVTFHVPKVYLKDFLNYFNILEESGYIIEKNLYIPSNKIDIVNLNYFTDRANIKRIIDINSIKYEKKYELEFKIEYPNIYSPPQLSIFDYTILERVRMVSVTGLTFDKRIETLNAIKEDIDNEIRRQRSFNKEFKNSIDKILKSPELKQQFLQFLEKNEDQGFFSLFSQINSILNYIDLIRVIINDHPEISNIYQLKTFLIAKLTFPNIEDQIFIRNQNIKKILFRDVLPLYFQAKSLFIEEVEKFQAFYSILNSCYNLKIIDIYKIITFVKNPNLFKEIYQTRKIKYDNIYKSVISYKITNERIESKIETFLNHDPPLLKPMLINTIFTSTFAKYYPEVILKDTSGVYEKLEKLKSYFPRTYIYKITDLFTNKSFIRVLIYSVNIKEKRALLSSLHSYFKDNLVNFNRYFWRGLMRRVRYEARDFYDFENGEFFYNKNFYKQILIYTQKIFGNKLEWSKHFLTNNTGELFWSERQTIDDLIDKVKYRISHQDVDFNLKELNGLLDFIRNFEMYLLDHAKFMEVKTKKFFKKYIKSIKFLPAFQKFGLSQYYLYFRPLDYSNVDFRLLFINSFQNIKYPASIEPNPAIFNQIIFPLRTPNKSYLNWLVKSKKNVSEYCLFYITKFYDITHFNRNLTKEGWNYSSFKFKSYMQNVLFNPTYNPKIADIREFDMNERNEPNIYGNYTNKFEALTKIYNTQSVDIKSYLGTRNYTMINNITELLKEKLIFPYISLQNLDFQDKISIILPNIKQEFKEKLMQIFGFFNVCRIYEIEGEFFIYGFQKEKTFETGLLIEIWFPKCELDEFFDVFDVLFQYLEINHYIILTDLVNGKTLLKSVYGNLNFLKEYNPLLNFKWNDKDKIWMNHKLFNEKFEPIYPELIPKKSE